MKMWKLEKHTDEQENEYFELVFKVIADEIKSIKSDSIKIRHLNGRKQWTPPIPIDSKLEKWFSSKRIVRRILLIKPEQMSNEVILYEKLKSRYNKIEWNDVERIINSDKFTQKKHSSKLGLKLAELKKVRSCPYCNRAFTMLVLKNNNYILRADFDHFLAKSKYPLFALSLYNLIPSCSNCNRVIKHTKEFEITTHLHPYVENFDRDNWEFDYRMLSLDKFLLIIDQSRVGDVRISRTIEDLKLEDIYQKGHSDFELKDLIQLNNSYGKSYINDLIDHIMTNSGLSEKEIFLYLFGVEIDKNDDLNRMLNKMRRDILNKLRAMD